MLPWWKIPPKLAFFQHHERECDILQYHEVERLLGGGRYGGDLQHRPLPLWDALRPTGLVWQKEGEAHHCQNESSLSYVTSNLSSSPVCVCIYILLLNQIRCSYSSVAMVTQSDSCYFVLLGGLRDNDGHFPKGNGLILKINLKINEQVSM